MLARKYTISLEEKMSYDNHYKRWFVVRGLYNDKISPVAIGRYHTRKEAKAAIKLLTKERSDMNDDLPRWEIRAKHGEHEEILGIYPATVSRKARAAAIEEHGERLGLRRDRRNKEWITTGWSFPRQLVKKASTVASSKGSAAGVRRTE